MNDLIGMNIKLAGQLSYRFIAFPLAAAKATFALNWALWLRLLFFINLSPEYVIVSGDKSTLIMRPVFVEYYIIDVY